MIVMEVLAGITVISIFLTAVFGGFEHKPKPAPQHTEEVRQAPTEKAK